MKLLILFAIMYINNIHHQNILKKLLTSSLKLQLEVIFFIEVKYAVKLIIIIVIIGIFKCYFILGHIALSLRKTV